jgi:DeoR family fructose operon transcriptional repressor
MIVAARQSQLLEMIRAKGFASLRELSAQLQVSESTVRRDLDLLERTGAARRTHGGAFYTGPSPKLPHFDQNLSDSAINGGEEDKFAGRAPWGETSEKKRIIAQTASGLIGDHETILLDGGSTTYELAQRLVGRPLQIVTNSLPVANLFAAGGAADLVLVGGNVFTRAGVSIGPYANQMLAELHVQRAVLSVAGVSEEGYYNSNLLLVETERAMMQAADEVIVVADSTKFGHKSLTRLCDLGDIDVLVVDRELSEDWQKRITAAGVRLLIAGQSENT